MQALVLPETASCAESVTIEALRRGDGEVVADLVRRYRPTMLRLARQHVADLAAAEDVVQETWVAVLRGVDRFDGRSSLKTWVLRILVNRAKTRGVKESRQVPVSALRTADGDRWLVGVGSTPDPVEHVIAAAEVDRVVRAIDQLPRRQREVITLRDVRCWDASEVCAAMGLSDVHQRVLLHRARAEVRRRVRPIEALAQVPA